MTKRMVQGGEATSERRRRDGVYQKSFKRAFLPLKKHLPVSATPTHCVHWFIPACTVSRTSHAWRVRAANGKAKVGGFALRAISAIPRVRTYHTKKPSRFVHALSARPLDNGWRGRGWSPCADETIKITFISLCSHADAHPNLNREVLHSLTWHSSESESARERFEPVAVAKL